MKEKIQKELVIRSSEQEYAKVLKSLGDSRFQLELQNLTTKLGIIRGNMRKRNWIAVGDYVLVSLRDFQDNKCPN